MNNDTLNLRLDLLDPGRREILSGLAPFSDVGVLSGGTALMLQIAHRRSYDFDILSLSDIPTNLLRKINEAFSLATVETVVDTKDELTVLVNGVKVTFFYYPFSARYDPVTLGPLVVDNILDIASNKAYVIGRRPQWRDYVDLFFLLRDHTDLGKTVEDANRRFGGNFSEKLFLEQLTYYGDIREYVADFVKEEIKPAEVKKFLEMKVRDYLGWRG